MGVHPSARYCDRIDWFGRFGESALNNEMGIDRLAGRRRLATMEMGGNMPNRPATAPLE